jgi:hypothetical protein
MALAGIVVVLCAAGAARADEREGLLLGVSVGFGGTQDCSYCELVGGIALGAHVGWTVQPRLTVVAEGMLLGLSDDDSDATASLTSLAGMVQVWPLRWLWVGGGLGVQDEEGDSGSTWVVASGLDLRSSRRVGIDLRSRYEQRFQAGPFGHRGSFIAGVGFTWY